MLGLALNGLGSAYSLPLDNIIHFIHYLYHFLIKLCVYVSEKQ